MTQLEQFYRKGEPKSVRRLAAVTQKQRFVHAPLVAVVAAVLLGSPVTGCRHQAAPASSSAVAVDHVALHVADLEASAAFYSGVFGLQEIPAAARGRRWFSVGKGVALHLLGGRSDPVADNRSVHVALTSDNLEPILQRLRERGLHGRILRAVPVP